MKDTGVMEKTDAGREETIPEVKDEKKKRLLFCYLSGGMTAERIPKGLNPGRQAIIDGIGAQAELEGVITSIS